MSKQPPATLASLRRALATAEALAGGLRAKLAKMEAAESGNPAPVCGLDLLWDAALPKCKERSSKQACRKAWAAIPSASRPTIAEAVAALKAWNRCDGWYANDNIYAPGLHKFISNRLWESLPAKPKPAPLHRNMSSVQPLPLTRPHEGVTDPAEIARLLGVVPRPAPPAKPKDHINGPEQIAAMMHFLSTAQPS